MRTQLTHAQLEFTRNCLDTDNARDLYVEHARRKIHSLTNCYPDLPDWHNNRDQWVLPFGLWIDASRYTPEAVAKEFEVGLARLGLSPESVALLQDVTSLFGYYYLRQDADVPTRFLCTTDYFERDFFNLLLVATGKREGRDYKQVGEWIDEHPEVRGSTWEVTFEGIRVKKFKNGRIDTTLNEAQLTVVRRAIDLFLLDKELRGKAVSKVRAEQDKEQQARIVKFRPGI